MFMVFVAGKQAPRIMHPTEAGAREEAERLAKLPDNLNIHVYVLKLIAWCSCEPSPIEWREVK